MHHETKVSNYLLAAFSAVALVLLSLPLTGPVRSFKACAVYLLNPVAYYGAKGAERLASIPSGIARLISVDIENQELAAEVQKGLLVKMEAEAIRRENERLTQALGLKVKAHGRSALWARVMERDPLHWYRSIMIDAGLEQGIAVNDAVLGQKGDSIGAIGRIIEVRQGSSVVLLLTDELSSVAAYLYGVKLEGLVQGQGGSRLRMNYLDSDISLQSGDVVYTSPTSATFPGDILIGTVVKILPPDPFLTFQSVEIRPAINASSLNEVFVLKPAGGQFRQALPETEVKAP